MTTRLCECHVETQVIDAPAHVEAIPLNDGADVEVKQGDEDIVEGVPAAVDGRDDVAVKTTNEASAISTHSMGTHRDRERGEDGGHICVHFYISGTANNRSPNIQKANKTDSPEEESSDDISEEVDGVDLKGKTSEESDDDEDDEDEVDTLSTPVTGGVISAPRTTEGVNAGRAGVRYNYTARLARLIANSGVRGTLRTYMEQKTYTPLQKWEYENDLAVDGVTDVKRWAIEVGLAAEGEDDAQKAKRVKTNNAIEPPKYGSSGGRIMISSAPDPVGTKDDEKESKPDDDDDGTSARKGKKKM